MWCEVHGAKKGLVLYLRPEHQKLATPDIHLTISPCHLKPTNQTELVDHRSPINAVPPKPKYRNGQGRAGIRRKPRMAPPITMPKPLQMSVAPIPTLAPRTVQPLANSEVQSQEFYHNSRGQQYHCPHYNWSQLVKNSL